MQRENNQKLYFAGLQNRSESFSDGLVFAAAPE